MWNYQTEKLPREKLSSIMVLWQFALLLQKEVLLVKQYRKPIEKPLLEIPAGKLEEDEEREEAETRIRRRNWLQS